MRCFEELWCDEIIAMGILFLSPLSAGHSFFASFLLQMRYRLRGQNFAAMGPLTCCASRNSLKRM